MLSAEKLSRISNIMVHSMITGLKEINSDYKIQVSEEHGVGGMPLILKYISGKKYVSKYRK